MNATFGRPLDGDVVLVTGARGGIGRAACAALAAAGARVVATGVGDAPIDLKSVHWSGHDVTLAEDWRRVVDDVHAQFGRLDCLINNAGAYLLERVADTSLEQWRHVFSVNVESVLLGLQAAAPLLRESGSNRTGGASVVNVASIAAQCGGAFSAAYCASKGALTLLSRSAAREFAALGYPIRVNSIEPGVVETRMMDRALERCVQLGLSESREQQKALWCAHIPLGRVARPEEIVGSIVFLCSPAASFMTGSELIIDGGATA